MLAAPDASATESLAGSKGDSRYPVYFAPGSTGGCQKAYKAYVATGSHSAYASTPFNWATEFVVCARANAFVAKGCRDAGAERLSIRPEAIQGHDSGSLQHRRLQVAMPVASVHSKGEK